MPYTPHMNSWVLDEWLYYEKLPNTTELKQNPYKTKEKTTYVYEALTYYYESMTMASPALHFQAVFQRKSNSLITTPAFIHVLGIFVIKFTEEILLNLH